MSQFDNIDDLFRSGLEKFSPPPSEKLWGNISERLDTSAPVDDIFREKLSDLEVTPSAEVRKRIFERLPLHPVLSRWLTRASMLALALLTCMVAIYVLDKVSTDNSGSSSDGKYTPVNSPNSESTTQAMNMTTGHTTGNDLDKSSIMSESAAENKTNSSSAENSGSNTTNSNSNTNLSGVGKSATNNASGTINNAGINNSGVNNASGSAYNSGVSGKRNSGKPTYNNSNINGSASGDAVKNIKVRSKHTKQRSAVYGNQNASDSDIKFGESKASETDSKSYKSSADAASASSKKKYVQTDANSFPVDIRIRQVDETSSGSKTYATSKPSGKAASKVVAVKSQEDADEPSYQKREVQSSLIKKDPNYGIVIKKQNVQPQPEKKEPITATLPPVNHDINKIARNEIQLFPDLHDQNAPQTANAEESKKKNNDLVSPTRLYLTGYGQAQQTSILGDPTQKAITDLTGNGTVSKSFTLGYQFGIGLGYRLNRDWSILAAPSFGQFNQKYQIIAANSTSSSADLSVNTFSVPVSVRYQPHNFALSAGVVYSKLLQSNFNGNNNALLESTLVNNGIGLTAGIDYNHPIGKQLDLTIGLHGEAETDTKNIGKIMQSESSVQTAIGIRAGLVYKFGKLMP